MLTPEKIFQQWAQIIEADPDSWRAYGGSCLARVGGENRFSWLVDCGTQPEVRRLHAGEEPVVNCRIDVEADELIKLVEGGDNLQQAFLNRRLIVTGDKNKLLAFSWLWDKFSAEREVFFLSNR